MLHVMTHRVTIRRRLSVRNGSQIKLGEPSDVATGVQCMIQQETGRLVDTLVGQQAMKAATGFFLTSVELFPYSGNDTSDLVIIEVHPTLAVGTKFRVIGVADPVGRVGSINHKEVSLELVR